MANNSYNFDMAKNGSENREPLAAILSDVNEGAGGTAIANGLIVSEDKTITSNDLMTPAEVVNVFTTGINTFGGKAHYVYVTGVDAAGITENNRKKAITNAAFTSQLIKMENILNAIIKSTPLT